MVYRFGPFELDESLYELRREGTDLRLRRRSFEVLRLLIDERARVVSKDELLDRVWGRRFVSQSALANCISELRAAFGGELEASAIIRTVYGRGYRFVAKLDEPAPIASGFGVSPNGVAEPVGVSSREVFVGRERELERLEIALDAARAGRPQVAIVSGEAGIGKSSTAARFAARARARGVRVLDGSCSDNGVAPIGWPWPRLLRSVLGDDTTSLTEESRAALARLLPELRTAADEGRSNESQPPTRSFEVATRVLLRAAIVAPLLVIVDDMHLADSTSLSLLGFFASQLVELPIMVLCTTQPPGRAVPRALARLLAELGRHPASQSLELEPLSRGEVEQLVERSGVGAPKLAERIFARSEGNPLFVAQLLRLVEDHPGSGAAADAIALPPGLSATIALRLSRLGSECRALLGVASAIGRSFRTHLLQRAAELTPRECLDLLQEAADARLVEETGTPGASESFRFRHGLIRAGVYQALAAGERAEIHRRIGLALRASEDKISDELAGYLAHHYYQSHDPELERKAVAYGERAARHAVRHREYERAAEHYARAVGAAIELGFDSLRICDLQLACVAELRRSIQCARADEMLAKAIERARSLRAFDRLAGAALVWGGMDTIASADPVWCRLIDEALHGIARENAPARASLLVSLALARLAADPADVNEARVREAIALAEAHDCRPVLRHAQGILYAFVRGPEQPAEVRSAIDGHLRAGLASPIANARIGAAVASSVHRLEWLQPEDASKDDPTLAAVTGDERTPALLGVRVARNLMRGKLDEAERDMETMWRDWLPIPTDGRLPVTFMAFLFSLRREQGRLAELDAPLRTAIQRSPDVTLWRVFHALALAETGRAAEAAEVLAGLTRDNFSGVPRNGYWIGNAMYTAEAAAAIAHAPSAEILQPLLAPFAERGAMMCRLVFAGPIELALGRLATTRGDYADSEAHLDAAERACLALGATSFELRTRFARADLFAARGAHARADALRREARAQALELGLRGLLNPA